MKFRNKLLKDSKDYDDWLRLKEEAKEKGEWIDDIWDNHEKYKEMKKKDKNVAKFSESSESSKSSEFSVFEE